MEILFGKNPVLEALKAGRRRFASLTVSREAKADPRLKEICRLGQALKIRLDKLPKDQLSRLAGTPKHQGVIARVSPLPLLRFEEILDRGLAKGDFGFLLLLDRVEDPGNLGAILRTAEALGVDGVLLSASGSAPLSPTVAKASAGALEHLPIGIIKNCKNSLKIIKQAGFWCLGLDMEGKESCGRFAFKGPTMLIVGGEDQGIRKMLKGDCDYLLSIDLEGKINSLNVSAATAIAIFEIQRARLG